MAKLTNEEIFEWLFKIDESINTLKYNLDCAQRDILGLRSSVDDCAQSGDIHKLEEGLDGLGDVIEEIQASMENLEEQQ